MQSSFYYIGLLIDRTFPLAWAEWARWAPMGPKCLVPTVCAPWPGQHKLHCTFITWLCTRKNQVLLGHVARVIKKSMIVYIIYEYALYITGFRKFDKQAVGHLGYLQTRCNVVRSYGRGHVALKVKRVVLQHSPSNPKRGSSSPQKSI